MMAVLEHIAAGIVVACAAGYLVYCFKTTFMGSRGHCGCGKQPKCLSKFRREMARQRPSSPSPGT